MGDVGEYFNDLREHRRDIRTRFGVNCPKCAEVRPKTSPSILLPGQRCKVDRYVDPRPRLTDEQQGIVRHPS